ncbi:hypothetical protein Q9Q99_13310 [Curtobacterium flaccumfaciens]|nr:hypothetical protein Q9Q99_13310 [Curtobacterium flaccumfaciens]
MPNPCAFLSFDFDHNQESKILFCRTGRFEVPYSVHRRGLVE